MEHARAIMVNDKNVIEKWHQTFTVVVSVAEPGERHNFAGAVAKFFWPSCGSGSINSFNIPITASLRKPQIFLYKSFKMNI
jgi:hypothetical protein